MLGACSTNPDNIISGRSKFKLVRITMDRMTTQGKLSEATIARAREVLPDPELPAMPIMLVFAHGGE